MLAAYETLSNAKVLTTLSFVYFCDERLACQTYIYIYFCFISGKRHTTFHHFYLSQQGHEGVLGFGLHFRMLYTIQCIVWCRWMASVVMDSKKDFCNYFQAKPRKHSVITHTQKGCWCMFFALVWYLFNVPLSFNVCKYFNQKPQNKVNVNFCIVSKQFHKINIFVFHFLEEVCYLK